VLGELRIDAEDTKRLPGARLDGRVDRLAEIALQGAGTPYQSVQSIRRDPAGVSRSPTFEMAMS